MKKIVITGAGGFLGTALMHRLVNKPDIMVYAFSFDFERHRSTFVRGDNIIPVDNSEIDTFDFSIADYVIHCAFPRNADSAVISDGLDFVAKVLKRAASSGAVINISSQSVYSPQRKCAAKETDKPVLENKYAIGKYASELLNNTLCAEIPHTNIRMASLIGPDFDQRVTNKMVELALKNGELSVIEDNQTFGYLDIEDAADGILSLLNIPSEKWRSVYNLGNGRTYSLKTIAETVASVIKSVLGKHIEIKSESGDKVLNSALDGSTLMADTGYKPCVSLEESIHRILMKKIER
ncbi:MAG: NAD(P)-dependent oxidoreductase [Ruminococcus sp.]|nr:NAD(P)-dependent oxidoreductase [Ruminococcus sp.]